MARALALTFPAYAIGGLYVLGPVLGWLMCGRLVTEKKIHQLHWLVWVWIGAMAMMQVSLVVGHILQDLPVASLVKSSIGWAKGWALIALFIGAGMHINTGAQLWRSACIVGVTGLVLTPVLLVASLIGLPEVLFVSPLKVIGGSGPEYFEVRLFEHDSGFGMTRLRFFAPWGPAIGLVANILMLLCLLERDRRWRVAGVVGCLTMVFFSLSRLGWIVALTVPSVLLFFRSAQRPALWFAAVPVALLAGLLLPAVMDPLDVARDSLMSARADSTLVREWLADIAWHRSLTEAPMWGHGIVQPGPHLVQFMPIGSHHTWLGLFFVKGLVGVAALGIPLVLTIVYLASAAVRSALSRIALGVVLVLALYTFGENLEMLAYLYWPGLVLIGHALATLRSPQ
ncbi:MAG: O-antigen ligase domain-containing protein [Pseudomonadota bacterium]